MLTKRGKRLLAIRREQRDEPPEVVAREALIITRKKPFIEWMRAAGEVNEYELAPAIYLLAEVYWIDDLERFLKHSWRSIFEHELWDWRGDESLWPRKRTRAMFDAWFNVQRTRSVYDCQRGRLRKGPR